MSSDSSDLNCSLIVASPPEVVSALAEEMPIPRKKLLQTPDLCL
ncbi:hypothetical protein DHBDCA_p2193 [Dehalobacter sp. DCA]|nr:hypothetical protein DHBDCA_p2193 [Dehalobacter sp. DCA]